MKIKLQADNDFNGHVIKALLQLRPEIDFRAASTIGLYLGVPDEKVLEIAASQGRVVVSHGLRTMPYHFGDFLTRQSSPGLILVSQNLSIRQVSEELLLVWEASEAEEYINRIYRLT